VKTEDELKGETGFITAKMGDSASLGKPGQAVGKAERRYGTKFDRTLADLRRGLEALRRFEQRPKCAPNKMEGVQGQTAERSSGEFTT